MRIVDVPAPSIADAHRLQELAQLDDVRFGRGVADLGDALGRGRGEQRRLGAGDRRFVEIERRAASGRPARRARSPTRRDDARAERDQRLHVRGDGAARRESRRPAAPGARGRCARAAGPAAAPSRAAGRPASDRACRCVTFVQRMRDRRRAEPARPRRRRRRAARPSRRRRGCAARSSSSHGLVGQQARRQQRQRRVLVAFDRDAAGQPAAAFDEQCGHGSMYGAEAADAGSVELSEVDDLFAQRDAEALDARRACSARSGARISRAVASPSWTMKLPCGGDTRAPPRARP